MPSPNTPKPRTTRSARRSIDSGRHWSGDHRSVDRVRHRGFHRLRRRLHAQVQLCLHELDRVVVADDLAADGDQSARGVRVASAMPAPRRSTVVNCRTTAASSTPSSPRRARCRLALGAHDRAKVADYLDDVVRSSAGFSGPSAAAVRHRLRRQAARHPRFVRSACDADERPARHRLPGRLDAHLHVHDVARR